MLRISAGLYKGRVLKVGKNPVIRPTVNRVKLSFFNILQTDIKEKIFLDGFAGSGNIGLEALSRGVDYVVFVDELLEAVRIIQHNLDKIGVPSDYYRIIKGDFNRSIIRLAKDGFQFDYIYLDPPYQYLTLADPVKILFKRGILKKNGQIILERPSSNRFQSKYYRLIRTRRIGTKSLDFYGL